MHVLGVPWLQLPGQQNILVQVLFTESDYSIRVTDLSTIWGEDLSTKNVKARADSIDCPIDAEANLEDLLKRLQNALTVDSNTTAIVLRRKKEALRLSTCERFGATLLKWEFCLTALPYSAVANGLTLSLFAMVSFYQNQARLLLDVIEDKDKVIKQMDELCKRSSIRFKPNRRQQAFTAFDKRKWLESRRSKAESEAKGAQDVIDELSLVGREPEFRSDWRAVLLKVPEWDVSFLPDTTERTPSKVTSSATKNGPSRSKANNFGRVSSTSPVRLIKEDTEAQSREFISLETIKRKEKKKLHTKWSSPYHSGAEGPSNESDDPEDEVTPMGFHSKLKSSISSPTPRIISREQKLEVISNPPSSPPPIYKIRDNRESQVIEPDLDLYSDVLAPSSEPDSPRKAATRSVAVKNMDSDDETTDESEEETQGSVEHRNLGKVTMPKEGNFSDREDGNRSGHMTSPSKGNGDENPLPNVKSQQGALTSSPTHGVNRNISVGENTPRRSRVKNIISPRKPRSSTAATDAVAISPPRLASEDSQESSLIDLELQRRERALQKRKEAEQLLQQSPSKKRARRF